MNSKNSFRIMCYIALHCSFYVSFNQNYNLLIIIVTTTSSNIEEKGFTHCLFIYLSAGIFARFSFPVITLFPLLRLSSLWRALLSIGPTFYSLFKSHSDPFESNDNMKQSSI